MLFRSIYQVNWIYNDTQYFCYSHIQTIGSNISGYCGHIDQEGIEHIRWNDVEELFYPGLLWWIPKYLIGNPQADEVLIWPYGSTSFTNIWYTAPWARVVAQDTVQADIDYIVKYRYN